MLRTLLLSLASFNLLFGNAAAADKKPLKVYILAGQSNMQGHAHVRTFDHLGWDPRTAPILKAMRKADGTPRVCDSVWISSLGSARDERRGKLTAGFGAEARGPKIGPEFTFGIFMQKHVAEPILIIKTAWGGKSLHTDFRPPSAGPYKFNEQQIKQFKQRGITVSAASKERAKATGHYYRQMVEHVRKVLKDIKRVFPGYDAQAGYELAGFVWFQGWNDMVDGGTYPNRDKPDGYAQYSTLLAHFIRDVRKDLAAPRMPFVIGVMGVGGPTSKYSQSQKRYQRVHQNFRNAMAAPAALPEFQGNVAVVLTEKSWDPQLQELSERWDKVRAKSRSLNRDKNLTRADRKKALEAFTAKTFTEQELKIWHTGTSNAAFHYLGSAKIMAQIGKAFANAMIAMSAKRK